MPTALGHSVALVIFFYLVSGFSENKFEMQPKTLRIASFKYPPYVFINETRKGVGKITGGIDAYVINILKEKFNFEYEAVIPTEPEWGKLRNGRWTGVIGMVYRNEVDLGISNIMITESRFKSVIFTVPYNSDGWVLVSLAPHISVNKQAVLQPFKGEVWLALLVSVLISTCLLFTLQTLRSHFKWTPQLTWRNTLWNVVAALCQEGVKLTKMNRPVLTFFVVWIFSTMILQVSYSGTLIGFLTFPEPENSISSIEDLAIAVVEKDVKISFGFHSLAESLLEGHEKYGSIFTKTIHSHPEALVSDQQEGFQNALKGNHVFIGSEFGTLFGLLITDFTKLQTNLVLNRNYIAIVVSQKFQYLKDFNIILRRLSESGLIDKWKKDILIHHLVASMDKQSKEDTPNEEFSPANPLKIGHLRGAFLLLTIGYALSSACFLSEMFCRW